MKFLLLIFLLFIALLQAQRPEDPHHGRHNQTDPRGNHTGNFTMGHTNYTMNHTHPYRPDFNFTNYQNSSALPFPKIPLPPFLNHSDMPLFDNFTDQELTHYEESFLNSLEEILKQAFNHSQEEINEFKTNMTYALNETIPPDTDHNFHSFFNDFLDNMSSSVSEDIDYFNVYEPEEDELKNVFMLLDQSSNHSINSPAKDLLQELQQEIQIDNPDLNTLLDREQTFIILMDMLEKDKGIDQMMGELIKLQVHNVIQQKYEKLWMASEINELAQLKQNPILNQKEIQQKQFIIQLQNQTLIRSKLISLLEDQLLQNAKQSSTSEQIPSAEDLEEMLNSVHGILQKQELHYDIQELYEELEQEIKYLNSTEKQNDVRQEAIRVLNNSVSTQEELAKLKAELEQLVETQFKQYNEEFYGGIGEEYEKKQEKQKSGNPFLIVVIIILILIIVSALGYYLYMRQKKRNELIRFTSNQETNGFFRQIDESAKA